MKNRMVLWIQFGTTEVRDCVCVCTHTHMVMEAAESQDLKSASWTLGAAFQSWSGGLKTRKLVIEVSEESRDEAWKELMFPLGSEGRNSGWFQLKLAQTEFLLLSLFDLLQSSPARVGHTPHPNLLYSVTNLDVHLI